MRHHGPRVGGSVAHIDSPRTLPWLIESGGLSQSIPVTTNGIGLTNWLNTDNGWPRRSCGRTREHPAGVPVGAVHASGQLTFRGRAAGQTCCSTVGAP